MPRTKQNAPRILSQRQRSEISRSTLLDAAIASLNEFGFGGTTTLKIQQRAGFSRGRLLHQFGSRAELLVAAVQHLAASRFASIQAEELPGPAIERAREAIRLLWSTHDGPLFWAAMETWLGARTDPGMADALRIEEHKLGGVIRAMCDSLFGFELVDRPNYPAFREMLITSMRGVALTYSFEQRPMAGDPHLGQWLEIAVQLLAIQPGDEQDPDRLPAEPAKPKS